MKLLFALLLCLCWPLPLLAAPDITETCNHYEVRGITLSELSKQGLHSVKPPGWNKQAVGLTNSEVNWRYTMQPSEHGCIIEDVAVTANIVTSLPYWNEHDREQATPETRVVWDNYLRALKLHENDHKQITLDYARTLEAELKTIPRQGDCDGVSREAKRIGDAIMDRHEDAQEEYDRVTRHGETQGVRLH